MSALDFASAVSRFGASATAKLSNPVAEGQPEDQLRGPLEALIADFAALLGFSEGAVVTVGESSLSDLKTRPDYAVTVANALVGFIEVKAPGKGADPRRFTNRHDKAQWDKLESLPNLIYTDGNAFSLWRDGELWDEVLTLDGDVSASGDALRAPPALLELFREFLGWKPVAPRSVRQLADTSARLCRLLRDEVVEQMNGGNEALTSLAEDWRQLLFPDANDKEFADGYAQAVTFGLLMARARSISLDQNLDAVARQLSVQSSLIGTALKLLTDQALDRGALDTSTRTLTRVLGVVEWGKLVQKERDKYHPELFEADALRDRPEPWLYFYEDFLAVYDNDLRKQTGSYYTPPEVVREMVRLVHDALTSSERFDLPLGLAAPTVTVADPAVGAGTFLLGVLRRIADTVREDQGAGAVPGAIIAAAERLIGFELQFGPFAVAQLRLTAEIVELATPEGQLLPARQIPDLRLFVTDTLGDPFESEEWRTLTSMRPLAESRRRANEIKRKEQITVVIGNPPYKDKAKGLGGWIEQGGQRDAPLATWQPPRAWNVGAHAKHLRNLYVYFWRWATWKVFGAGRATTQEETTSKDSHEGIISYITVAGFLNGPGFQQMRADLRRTASEVWVIDASPEGHQPAVSSRVFQGVQQPVCIVMAARTAGTDPDVPARVRYTALPEGNRTRKFAALAGLALDGDAWADAPDDWRAPFLPAATGAWAAFPALDDLFVYDGSGVMPGRTWPIAPDAGSLRKRWARLTAETDPEKKEELFKPHLRNGKPGDKHVNKEENTGGFPGHESRAVPVAQDSRDAVTPTRYGFRSFDRQFIIPDKRLLNQANPTLWKTHSLRQVYLTALNRTIPSSGPAISFSAAVPDMDHYNGRGGRVFPLWADPDASRPNVNVSLLAHLTGAYRREVTAEDVMAYLAAVAAHPGYIERFEADLVRPGLRIPITAAAELFTEAAALGREVVWLHTYGERFADPKAEPKRPARPPRVEDGLRPANAVAIPDDADDMHYDADDERLHVGTGYVDHVPQAVWDYEVSGKNVLTQWFSYRRADRSRPLMGDRRPPSPLNAIQPDGWTAEYTTELLNLLHVLARLVALEPAQADLLARICDGPLLDADEMRAAGAFDAPTANPRAAAASSGQRSLL